MLGERPRPTFGFPEPQIPQIRVSEITDSTVVPYNVPPGKRAELVADYEGISAKIGIGTITKHLKDEDIRVVPLALYDGSVTPRLRMNVPEKLLPIARELFEKATYRRPGVGLDGRVIYEIKAHVLPVTKIIFTRDEKAQDEYIVEGIMASKRTVLGDQTTLQFRDANEFKCGKNNE